MINHIFKTSVTLHEQVNNLVFNLQLKEKISTIGDGHQAEVDGMKEQIANMTAELHKRWLSLFVCHSVFVCLFFPLSK